MMLVFLSACSFATAKDTHKQELAPKEVFHVLIKGQESIGVCSGTAVSSKALLTASHCFKGKEVSITLTNDYQTIHLTEFEIVKDSKDNAFVVVKENTFKSIAPVSFNYKPKRGDDIHIIGNPSGFYLLRREGTFTGDYVTIDLTGLKSFPMYNINAYKGDSGSCIFNTKNVCIAVLSFAFTTPDGSFKLIGSTPFSFTSEQLKKAGL